MQCYECLYYLGAAEAKQADFLVPSYEADEDNCGNDIPRIIYWPVCEDHKEILYMNVKPEDRLPFIPLAKGVLVTADKLVGSIVD